MATSVQYAIHAGYTLFPTGCRPHKPERYNNSHATTKNSAYFPGLTNKLKKNKLNKFLDGVLILLIKMHTQLNLFSLLTVYTDLSFIFGYSCSLVSRGSQLDV